MDDTRKHARQGAPALRMRNLAIEFARRAGPLRVVDGVSLDVWPGEIVGVIGESGSGKTLTSLSALRMLPKRAKIVEGSVHLGETDVLNQTERQMRVRPLAV